MFVPLDADGHLVNVADTSKVDAPWRSLIESLVTEYRSHYRDLASVYVRGSVAVGTATFGYSDLDLIAVTHQEHAVDRTWIREATERTLSRLSTVVDVDLAVTSSTAVLTDRKSGLFIKTQSALVYGVDFAPRIAPYRIDADAFSHLFNLELDLATVRRFVENSSETLSRTLVLRLTKRVIRAGLELVAERQQAYTRDLEACCEIFCRYYPEKAASMQDVLRLMAEPAEPEDALRKLESMIRWIAPERKRLYPREVPKISFIDDLGV